MIWLADSKDTYRCKDYVVACETGEWSAWNYSKRIACLGRGLTLKQAQAICEKDAKAAA